MRLTKVFTFTLAFMSVAAFAKPKTPPAWALSALEGNTRRAAKELGLSENAPLFIETAEAESYDEAKTIAQIYAYRDFAYSLYRVVNVASESEGDTPLYTTSISHSYAFGTFDYTSVSDNEKKVIGYYITPFGTLAETRSEKDSKETKYKELSETPKEFLKYSLFQKFLNDKAFRTETCIVQEREVAKAKKGKKTFYTAVAAISVPRDFYDKMLLDCLEDNMNSNYSSEDIAIQQAMGFAILEKERALGIIPPKAEEAKIIMLSE